MSARCWQLDGRSNLGGVTVNYQRGVLRIQAYRESPLQIIGQGARCTVGRWCSDGNMTRPTCSAVSSGLWNRGLRAIIHIYICRAPTRWQLPPFRHNSHLHIHTRVARTGCLDCTLRSPRPCNPNAALLDLFLFLFLFLFPIPGDRCCAALTSTYPTKPRLDCARSLETPRYDS